MRTIEDEMSLTADDDGSKPKTHLDAKEGKIAKEEPKVEKLEINWKRSQKLMGCEIFLCACDLCICMADFLTDICLKIWADTKCRLSNLTIAYWLKTFAANG